MQRVQAKMVAVRVDTKPGGVDKFRSKIWDKNNGDAVVYDNQMSAGIEDNPTTAIAGGSVVIHK